MHIFFWVIQSHGRKIHLQFGTLLGPLNVNHLTACSLDDSKLLKLPSPDRQPVPPLPRHHLQVNGCVKPKDLMMRCQPQSQLIFPKVVANDDSFTKQASTLRKPTKMHLHSFQEHYKNLLIQCCSSAIATDAILQKILKKKRHRIKKGHIFKIRLHEGILQKKPSILQVCPEITCGPNPPGLCATAAGPTAALPAAQP